MLTFLLLSLKYGALAGALDDIREAVGENTIVMSLMNGVDSEEIISTKIDKITYYLFTYKGGVTPRR